MERSTLEQHLAQTFERVSEGERRIAAQRNRVKLLSQVVIGLEFFRRKFQAAQGRVL
jgi:hypothetical protein